MYVCDRFVPDGTSLLAEFFEQRKRDRGEAAARTAEESAEGAR